MNMLAVALLGFGVKMLMAPKATAAQPLRRVEPPLPTLKPEMTESECASRGGIWTGTECLGAKSLAQVEAEAAARRARLQSEARARASYTEERQRMITDITRQQPESREGMYRRTFTLL